MSNMRLQSLRGFLDQTPPREVVVLDHSDDTLPFDRIECDHLKIIGKAWLSMSRADGECLPQWREFSPADYKCCLDKFCVLRVENGRINRIEFSLYGGHPTEYLGGGKPLILQDLRRDPLRSANFIDIRDRSQRAIDNQAPQYVRKTLSWNNRNYIEYETLTLPFVSKNGVQRILQPVSARARLRLVHSDQRPKWCEVRG